jgi:hypothetical protein
MHIYRQVSESSNVVTFQEKGVPSNKPRNSRRYSSVLLINLTCNAIYSKVCVDLHISAGTQKTFLSTRASEKAAKPVDIWSYTVYFHVIRTGTYLFTERPYC